MSVHLRRTVVVLLVLLVFSFFTSSAKLQVNVPTKQDIEYTPASSNIIWNQTYGGTGEDLAYQIIEHEDGGYVVAGVTDLNDTPGVWVFRIDENGNEVWSKSYESPGHRVLSLILCNDGGILVLGDNGTPSVVPSFGLYVSVHGTENPLISWLIKLDSSGNSIWNHTYDHANLLAVAECPDGGFILCGHSNDAYLMKTDSLGAIEWHKEYDDSYGLYKIIVLPDGSMTFLGSYGNPGKWDPILIHTDIDGNKIWAREYVFGSEMVWTFNFGRGLVLREDGGYSFAGYSLNGVLSETSPWIQGSWFFRTDSYGNIMETRGLYSPGPDLVYGMVHPSAGGYALVGCTQSFGAEEWDVWFVGADRLGSIIWNTTLGGVGIDIAYSIIECDNGDVIAVGWTDSQGAGGFDAWIIRLSYDYSRPTLTPNNQGLYWGVSYGDEMQFNAHYERVDVYLDDAPFINDIQEDMLLIVRELDQIPDDVNSIPASPSGINIGRPSFDLYWINSSSKDLIGGRYQQFTNFVRKSCIAMPIGNWPQMTEILTETLGEAREERPTSIFDYDEAWGFRITHLLGYQNSTEEWLFSKLDGSILQYHYIYSMQTEQQTEVEEFTLERIDVEIPDIPMASIDIVIVLVMGGAFGTAVLVLIIFRWRR